MPYDVDSFLLTPDTTRTGMRSSKVEAIVPKSHELLLPVGVAKRMADLEWERVRAGMGEIVGETGCTSRAYG